MRSVQAESVAKNSIFARNCLMYMTRLQFVIKQRTADIVMITTRIQCPKTG